MRSLSTLLRALQATRYVTSSHCDKNGEFTGSLELLPSGRRYCEQLQQQWRNTWPEGVSTHFANDDQGEPHSHSNADGRLSFVYSKQFREQLRGVKGPTAIKTALRRISTATGDSGAAKLLQFVVSPQSGGSRLITDYFFESARGLEKFYNIQRERKIWWMRFSANPSRYFLEPFDLRAAIGEENALSSASCQSITIKSRFGFGTADLEHITLVPLCEVRLADDTYAELTNERQLPAVIRSVIDLEVATIALLLDGYDHSREDTLLLNRKLAPYQCAVTCFHKDKALTDLRDLCSHLSCVIRRAGLRLFDDKPTFTNCQNQYLTALNTSDSFGVPFTVIVKDESLFTGLLKLRNRDTTLGETIHISDIPAYLLKIFRC